MSSRSPLGTATVAPREDVRLWQSAVGGEVKEGDSWEKREKDDRERGESCSWEKREDRERKESKKRDFTRPCHTSVNITSEH